MPRLRFFVDYRIDYRDSKKLYHSKNVELGICVDAFFDVLPADEREIREITDMIWNIFISETTFTNFPDRYLIGTFEKTEPSRRKEKEFHIGLEYADYGYSKALGAVKIVKSFTEEFLVPDGYRLYHTYRDRFWDVVRLELRRIVEKSLAWGASK